MSNDSIVHQFITSLGRVCAVIGAQWGDEGKGKAIDMLAEHFDVVARASGGANAGHTIIYQGNKHVFHLLPSGSFHEGKKIVLGSGMVIHAPTLLQEIAALEAACVEIRPRLLISACAHIVLDCYKEIDSVLEERRAQTTGKIGTTKRGIGPAYMFKAMREGLRMECLEYPPAELRKKIATITDMAESLFGVSVNANREYEQLRQAADVLRGAVTDMDVLLELLCEQNQRILIEGAQATLLDIDHGTYPFVTSSSTSAAGALQSLGMPPKCLTSCIGVAKAYCTRVGEGEFSTEAAGAVADRLRERGGEYGATTGRPRRCGWLDIVNLNRASLINGFTCFNITKLDVLDEEHEIPVCLRDAAGEDTIVVKLPGWQTSTKGITSWDALPMNAKDYIRFIEEKTRIPVRMIGTGQKGDEIIVRGA